MKRKNIVFYLFGTMLLCSCLKDQGNYDYKDGTYIRIRHPAYSYTAFLNDTLTVYANREFKGGSEDSLKFDNAWYIDGELYSDQPELKFVGKEIGTFSGKYYAIDKETGVYTAAASGFTIRVTSPFGSGWTILYEKNNKSELAHIRESSDQYFDYTNIYKEANNGEELGSAPVALNDFRVTNTSGMYVLQHGGQGSVELRGDDYKKMLITNNSFVGGTPPNFKPVDIGLFATADMIVNSNGDVYPRYFNNPIPFTTPWLSLPMQVAKGMNVTDIWKSWSGSMAYAFMFDSLNNRILQVRLDAPNVTGGVAVIDTFPKAIVAPGVIVPDEYVYPNNIGSWQYIWGGTFHDGQYAAEGAFLVKNPVDQKTYLETFTSKSVSRVFQWSPKAMMEFPGASDINANSKFVALKSRDYLFYSGGAGNKTLYYFDILAKTFVPFTQLSSGITVLTASDDDNELAVGLADGTVILYDVSDQTIISGSPIELHRLNGLGRVVDIVVKGGRMN